MKKILVVVLILFSYVSANNVEKVKKACDKGNAKACLDFGAMYELGIQGVKKRYF